MGRGRGYLVMLSGKTNCHNSAFSLAEISRRVTQDGGEKRERKKIEKGSLRKNNKNLHSVDGKLASLCRM